MRKRLVVLSLSLLFTVLFVLSGCQPTPIPEEEPTDPTRTQISIANYDGGVGSEWLYDIKERFEEHYKDVCFEPGVYVNGVEKKGVQVKIRKSKNISAQTLINTMSSEIDDVFFVESVFYYEFVSQKNLLDITDIVTNPLTEFGDSATIESKLRPEYRDYIAVNADGEDQYFGLPHYEAFGGIVYNRALFDSRLLYIADDGYDVDDISEMRFVSSLDEKRSPGPDGDYDTEHDNGLPATYEEFYALCDRIKRMTYTPIIWSGQFAGLQTSYVYRSLFADYEGKDQFMLNYTFDGTATNIVQSIDENGVPVLTEKQITPSTGYELAGQAGKYYAIDFMSNILEKGFAGVKSFDLTYSHTDAQEDFVKSIHDGRPIAMLFDGSWWEREAETAGKFAGLPQQHSKEGANFGWMPLPKATSAKVGQGNLLVDANYSMGLIRGNTSKPDLAKKFLAFCYTDQSLKNFNMITGMGKGVNYSLTETELSSMTKYQRSLYDTKTNAILAFPAAQTNLFMYNQNRLDFNRAAWTTTADGGHDLMHQALKDYNITAKAYFEGMKRTATQWEGQYGKYFN